MATNRARTIVLWLRVKLSDNGAVASRKEVVGCGTVSAITSVKRADVIEQGDVGLYLGVADSPILTCSSLSREA